jgi:hypothetical protein
MFTNWSYQCLLKIFNYNNNKLLQLFFIFAWIGIDK